MDILFVLQQFNIIRLLNTVFPAGIGELIVLTCWIGFFALAGLITIVFVLTREQTIVNSRARVTMEEIGVLVFPGGGTKEFILPRKSAEFKYKMGEKDCTWTIKDDEWMSKSNGVRYTYFHPDVPHNISLNNLVRIILSARTEHLTEDNEIEYIPIENITFTAFEQDAKVMTIAQAYAKDLVDPNKKLQTAILAASIILSICIGGAILFIVAPKGTCTPAAEAIATVVTTTIPAISGIH